MRYLIYWCLGAFVAFFSSLNGRSKLGFETKVHKPKKPRDFPGALRNKKTPGGF
jgi:hypothetical protein